MPKIKFPNPLDKKYRWVLIGGAGVIILILIFGSRGQKSQGGVEYVSTGPSENLQLAAMQSGAQLSAQQNELKALEFQGQTQLALAAQAIQGEIALAGMDYNARSEAMSAELAALTKQLQTQENIAGIEAQLRSEETRANRDITMSSIQSNVDMFAMQVQSAFATSQLQADTIRSQIDASRDTTLAQIEAGRDAEFARLNLENTRLLTERDLGYKSLDVQRDIALDQGVTDRAAISGANKRNRSNNIWGTIGGIAGGIASIFSDTRVKDYIRQTGETPDGLPWYEYSVSGFTQAGVMAQEAMELYPEAVSPHYTGLLTVDYGYMGINSRAG